MRQFIVIPIAHSLKGNKVAKSNDIVCESQLTSPADALVSAGFLKEVFSAETTKELVETNDIEVKNSEEVVEEKPIIKEDVKGIKKGTKK